jgi:hypothetical protein
MHLCGCNAQPRKRVKISTRFGATRDAPNKTKLARMGDPYCWQTPSQHDRSCTLRVIGV